MNYDISKISIKGIGKVEICSKNNYSIAIVLNGNGFVSFGKQRGLCGQEEFILMQPGNSSLVWSKDSTSTIELLHLQLSKELLKDISDDYTNLVHSFELVPFGCATVRADSSSAMITKNLLKRLFKGQGSKDFGNEILVRGLLSMSIILVLRACIDADFKRPIQKRMNFIIDDVFVYIQEHLAKNITLATLESVFFVSHEHIAREFKRQTGQTIHQYLLALRLEKSCNLLMQGLAITQIWQLCGFNSYSYFFQAFKRRYGATPKQFVINTQNSINLRKFNTF